MNFVPVTITQVRTRKISDKSSASFFSIPISYFRASGLKDGDKFLIKQSTENGDLYFEKMEKI